MRTKKEIRLIISELEKLKFESDSESVSKRLIELQNEMVDAPEDFIDHILESHRTLCKVKNMGLKDAYGQDPFLYYAAGTAGESGEILNKLVKGYRDGYDKKAAIEAIRSELPDVFIYGMILAYVSDLDIKDEINKKTQIVVQRALDGYYGKPFSSKL